MHSFACVNVLEYACRRFSIRWLCSFLHFRWALGSLSVLFNLWLADARADDSTYSRRRRRQPRMKRDAVAARLDFMHTFLPAIDTHESIRLQNMRTNGIFCWSASGNERSVHKIFVQVDEYIWIWQRTIIHTQVFMCVIGVRDWIGFAYDRSTLSVRCVCGGCCFS